MKENVNPLKGKTKVFRADSEQVRKHADEIWELVGPEIEEAERARMRSAEAALTRKVPA